jgi:YidC/Oxa1 family membrane protein insertase
MEKNNNFIAYALIGIIFVAYMMYMGTTEKPVQSELEGFKNLSSSTISRSSQSSLDKKESQETTNNSAQQDSVSRINKFGKFFAQTSLGHEKTISIETDFIKAKISSKGASLKKWELNNYNKWDGEPVQLLWSGDRQLFEKFLTSDGKRIDTRDLYFKFSTKDDLIRLTEDQSYTISAVLKISDDKAIEKTYTFYGNKYHVDVDVKLIGLDNVLTSHGYEFGWENGIKYQEYNSVDESSESLAMAVFNGEKEEIDATDLEEKAELSPTGQLDFCGVKNKYFAAAIIPDHFDGTVYLEGTQRTADKEGRVEHYNISLAMPYGGGEVTNKFKVYIGPLDYKEVSKYGIEQLINFGWKFFGYIGEYLLMPFFLLVHMFIPNWGITIIVFSIFLKMALYPLSVTQMKSAQKMKLLGPQLTKLREKFEGDQQRQQQETMKLYSQYGINPMGGCLPMLLQMPILFSLWQVFRSDLNLRQAEFLPFWITDLSMPDVIVHFGFSVMGISSLSGLALLMGVTMFIQQKMTVSDPRQKAMIYMMPIMFTLMFSNFPSGLNLYYFVFNLLGIGQQVWINSYSKNKVTLEQLKKGPKKESWLQKKMAEAQQMQKMKQSGQIPRSNNPAEKAQLKYGHTPKKRAGSRKKPNKK